MQIFDKGIIYDFMGKRRISIVISLILFLGSLFLVATKGINYGIDFSGGTLVQVRYDKPVVLDEIRQKLSLDQNLKDASVTEFGSNHEIVIRYKGSSESLGSDAGDVVAKLLKDSGNFEIRRVDIVGPRVGSELREKGLMALGISFVLILIYIAFRFEWRFALAAIASEIHDIVITIGAISLLQIDVNLDTLAAILTVLGYSLNDTIIIFDRIREGARESKENRLDGVINEAVSATLPRTIMTSFTTLITVFILFIFGGDMIHGFSTILIIGIFIGTLSSVFIAAPMLLWFKFDLRKYRENLAMADKRKKEKEKIRAMYEQGVV